MRSPSPRLVYVAIFMALNSGVALVVDGCGSSAPPNADNDGTGLPSTGGNGCTTEGATEACHAVVSQGKGFVNCVQGTSTCTGGHWSACQQSATHDNTFTGGALSSLARGGAAGGAGGGGGLHILADPTPPGPDAGGCAADPCDPNCLGWDDSDAGTLGGGGTGTVGSGGGVIYLQPGWNQTQATCVTGGGANASKCPDDQCCGTNNGTCQAWQGAPSSGDCVPAAAAVNFTVGVGCVKSSGDKIIPICNRGANNANTGSLVVGLSDATPPTQAPFTQDLGSCTIDLTMAPIAANSCIYLDTSSTTQTGVTCTAMEPLTLPSRGSVFVNAGTGSAGTCSSYGTTCCSNATTCVTESNLYDNIGVWDWNISCSTVGPLGPSGLIRDYPLDNNLTDYGSDHIDLVSHGTGAFTTDRYGNPNTAYHLDGTTTYLTDLGVGNLPLGGSSRTVTFWIKPVEARSTTSIVGWGSFNNGGANGKAFGLGEETINGMANSPIDIKLWGNYDDACGYNADCNLHLVPGDWTFQAATYETDYFLFFIPYGTFVGYKDNSSVTRYTSLNHDLHTTVAPETNPSFPAMTGSLLVGTRGYGGSDYFYGDIDDIRVYDHVLSPTEVNQVRAGSAAAAPVGPFTYTGTCPTGAGLHVHWKYLQYVMTSSGSGGVEVDGFSTPELADGGFGTPGTQNALALLGTGTTMMGPALGDGTDGFPATCQYSSCYIELDNALTNIGNSPWAEQLTLTFKPQGTRTMSQWQVSYDCLPYE